MGRVKIALSKEKYVLFEVVKVNMLSVLSTCKCLVFFLPENSLNFLSVEYCKIF